MEISPLLPVVVLTTSPDQCLWSERCIYGRGGGGESELCIPELDAWRAVAATKRCLWLRWNHREFQDIFGKICLAHEKDTSFFTVRFVKVFLKASSAGALTFELFEAVSQWFGVVCMIPDPTGLPINRLPKQDVKRTVGPLACLNMWTPIRTSAILPTGNETIWYYL